ncbi:MAG: thioredoxin fold domain-containing protein [Gammaproteobacteria bacterium]
MTTSRMVVSLIVGWGVGLISLSASADPALEKLLAERLRAVIPDAEITSVKPAPLNGLYEVMLGPTVLYMTGDGRYALRGDIFDLDARANLTDSRRSEARAVAFHAQDDSAIEFAPANGKSSHTLYVFTDIDCGYCRKMHQEISKLNSAGIAVRYLAFPRSGLNGDSFRKAVAVWCAADRKKALTEAKLGKDLGTSSCDNPVTAQYNLGQAVGVRGTPAVFLDNGEEIGGYLPAAELIQMFGAGRI